MRVDRCVRAVRNEKTFGERLQRRPRRAGRKGGLGLQLRLRLRPLGAPQQGADRDRRVPTGSDDRGHLGYITGFPGTGSVVNRKLSAEVRPVEAADRRT